MSDGCNGMRTWRPPCRSSSSDSVSVATPPKSLEPARPLDRGVAGDMGRDCGVTGREPRDVDRRRCILSDPLRDGPDDDGARDDGAGESSSDPRRDSAPIISESRRFATSAMTFVASTIACAGTKRHGASKMR